MESAGKNVDNKEKHFIEMLKMSNFLNAIRANIALDLRKNASSSFQEACDLAIQMENAYNESNFEEINAIKNKDKKSL